MTPKKPPPKLVKTPPNTNNKVTTSLYRSILTSILKVNDKNKINEENSCSILNCSLTNTIDSNIKNSNTDNEINNTSNISLHGISSTSNNNSNNSSNGSELNNLSFNSNSSPSPSPLRKKRISLSPKKFNLSDSKPRRGTITVENEDDNNSSESNNNNNEELVKDITKEENEPFNKNKEFNENKENEPNSKKRSRCLSLVQNEKVSEFEKDLKIVKKLNFNHVNEKKQQNEQKNETPFINSVVTLNSTKTTTK
jgi:hypothetical protein